MAEEAGKAVREGRPEGWGGELGWAVGRVRWLAVWRGWPGGMQALEGQVGPGWLTGCDGGPGGRRGMDLLSKECSGVNIVT